MSTLLSLTALCALAVLGARELETVAQGLGGGFGQRVILVAEEARWTMPWLRSVNWNGDDDKKSGGK